MVPVSELMGHGEGQRQPRVLVDVAAPMGLAHPRHVGQPQGLAGSVHGCADVLPWVTNTDTEQRGGLRRAGARNASQPMRKTHGHGPNRSENGDIQRLSAMERFTTFPFPFTLPVSLAYDEA